MLGNSLSLVQKQAHFAYRFNTYINVNIDLAINLSNLSFKH